VVGDRGPRKKKREMKKKNALGGRETRNERRNRKDFRERQRQFPVRNVGSMGKEKKGNRPNTGLQNKERGPIRGEGSKGRKEESGGE